MHYNKKGLTKKEIFEQIIKLRFKLLKNDQEENELLKRVQYLENLTDLTFSILQIEGTITPKTPLHKQIEITAIIMDELRKKGLKEDIIGNI